MRFIRGQGSGVLAKSRNYETAAALPDNPANPVFWPSFALLAIAVASIAAPLLWHLSCFWQIDPQYSYGWIVPVLSVYLAWRRWKSRPAAEPAPSGTTICLAAALFLLSVVWLIREATPDWSAVSWILAILTAGSLALLVITAGGLSMARHFLFPICFILTAVPWPHRIEVAIVQNLMKYVGAAAAECANWMGIAALPKGNLIQLTNGYVGIAEACSGIRSLEAILMVSLVIGEFLRYSALKRGLFIFLGLAIAIICNVARTVVLVVVASSWGVEALGAWHQPTGLAVLVTAFALLGLIASSMPGKTLQELQGSSKGRFSASGRWSLPWPLAAAISVWVTATFLFTQFWYRSGDPGSLRVEIRWPESENSFRYLPMQDEARHVLLCTEGRIATWIDSDGAGWTLVACRWAPGRTATQSARLHRPENCFTASGAVLKRELETTTVMIDAVPITFRSYLFERDGLPLVVFYTLWEEANPDRLSGRILQDYSGVSRVQRVLTHERNLGQQSLEFVLPDKTGFQEIQSRFIHALPLLLSWKRA
jgi:exosortase